MVPAMERALPLPRKRGLYFSATVNGCDAPTATLMSLGATVIQVSVPRLAQAQAPNTTTTASAASVLGLWRSALSRSPIPRGSGSGGLPYAVPPLVIAAPALGCRGSAPARPPGAPGSFDRPRAGAPAGSPRPAPATRSGTRPGYRWWPSPVRAAAPAGPAHRRQKPASAGGAWPP